MKPRGGAAENRRSWRRVDVSQNSRQSVDPRSTGRHSEVVNGFVQRAGPGEPPKDHPAELAYTLCRFRGEHGLDTKPPRAGKREGNDFGTPIGSACGMDEVVSPEPEEPFDADVSRDGHDSVLRPSPLQGFAVGNRSDSPCVSVPLSPRLGPVSSKQRGPNHKGPEGLGTPSARELEGPVAVDLLARPRIGAQPARPLRDVNGDAPGHRCVSTSRTPGSGGAFRPREGGIASKTQQHDDTIILDSSSRP